MRNFEAVCNNVKAWVHTNPDLASIAAAAPVAALFGWWIVGVCIELGGLV